MCEAKMITFGRYLFVDELEIKNREKKWITFHNIKQLHNLNADIWLYSGKNCVLFESI